MPDADALIDAFHEQVRWCDRLGSPFNARLLAWLAEDWLAGGPTRTLLPAWTAGPPAQDLVPLRLAGALHALALSGRHPELARRYPPAAQAFDADALAPLLRRLLVDESPQLRAFLASAPQTNETMRSAVLLGGYAAIARATGLPLALREIGASAGLNLCWDRFHYQLGGQRWGDAASPVHIVSEWHGAVPALPARIAVADRRGNDLLPVDLRDPAAVLRLRSYVWPDQAARAARLQGAIALAGRQPPVIDAGDAADWVERQLAAPREGMATVLVHSVVWQYLPQATRDRIEAALLAAAARSTRTAPLAWLRMELFAPGAPAELRLTLWPEGNERTLAEAHPHGEWVEWLG
ncbi:DUF2332 domain-containing protein [uncultured Piscinibacter sp.]|uniref:DUF2332 domain-containing protein n=1 Tax=uncultured Piscinibacter sp. TaxID=1131835 RepID=UPI00260A6944|nr:DUF2332 domain-containing protein [uncultured Piscinibacter sp.]